MRGHIASYPADNGQGYEIEKVRELVRRSFGVMKVVVELTALSVGAAAAAGLVSNLVEGIGTGEIVKNEDLLGLKARYEELADIEGHRMIKQQQTVTLSIRL